MPWDIPTLTKIQADNILQGLLHDPEPFWKSLSREERLGALAHIPNQRHPRTELGELCGRLICSQRAWLLTEEEVKFIGQEKRRFIKTLATATFSNLARTNRYASDEQAIDFLFRVVPHLTQSEEVLSWLKSLGSPEFAIKATNAQGLPRILQIRDKEQFNRFIKELVKSSLQAKAPNKQHIR